MCLVVGAGAQSCTYQCQYKCANNYESRYTRTFRGSYTSSMCVALPWHIIALGVWLSGLWVRFSQLVVHQRLRQRCRAALAQPIVPLVWCGRGHQSLRHTPRLPLPRRDVASTAVADAASVAVVPAAAVAVATTAIAHRQRHLSR